MSQELKDRLLMTVSILTLLVSIIWFLSEPKFEYLMLVLSTIATTLTLYSSKKKLEKRENIKYIAETRQLAKTSVIVWGPTQSGKSWLIKAFAKSVSTKYFEKMNGLVCSLSEQFPGGSFVIRTTHADVNDLQPTSRSKVSTYKFERKRTSNTFKQRISSFVHELSIIDMRGADLVAAPLIQGQKFRQTLSALADADVVVIALDPLIYDVDISVDFPDDLGNDKTLDSDYPEIALRPGLSGDDYAKILKRLFQVLEAMRPNKKRYYAVCLMKADQIIQDVYHNDPIGLINYCFGESLVEVLNSIDPSRLSTFTVSAAGFILSGEGVIPNFSHGRLNYPDCWEPYGVEHPFFWAFEKIEKDILRERFNETWWGRLVANRRLGRYVPYPKLEYKLPEQEISFNETDGNLK